MMLKIGLTGGIASGKSLASDYFNQLGVDVIDTDKIARELFKDHSPHLIALEDQFGKTIFSSDGVLDRKALATIIFSNKKQLKWLNDFSHPLISEKIIQQLSQLNSHYVIIDIPLLVDINGNIPNHLKKLIDRVLVIEVNENIQLSRLIKRDNLTKLQALKIIQAQSSNQQKSQVADDIVNNNGKTIELKKQIKQMHEQYITLSKGLHS